MADRYVLLSFIYTGCSDPKGCPLAIHTLDTIRQELEKNPAVSGKLLFIALSFDPEHDTPEAMRKYADARGFAEARQHREWLFLTTSSKSSLRPILDGYGQYVVREYDKAGRPTGGYSHVLKIFLIDPNQNVRNIYSTSFLFPQLLINDIKTLIGEEAGVR
jgi:cytochrome c peroxidase